MRADLARRARVVAVRPDHQRRRGGDGKRRVMRGLVMQQQGERRSQIGSRDGGGQIELLPRIFLRFGERPGFIAREA